MSGGPPPTPLGHPVVSRYDALSRRIGEDVRAHGADARIPSSAYRLQSLYLDFGRVAGAEYLAEQILRAIEDARDAEGLRGAGRPLGEAKRPPLGDVDERDPARARQRLMGLSRRALMTALVFNAHFWNVRLALEVVAGEEDLEQATLATCAFVAERRTGRSVRGDLRYYAPVRLRNEAFCSDHCLPALGRRPPEDRACVPPRTPADCGMLRILEGFRFFASFPDE